MMWTGKKFKKKSVATREELLLQPVCGQLLTRKGVISYMAIIGHYIDNGEKLRNYLLRYFFVNYCVCSLIYFIMCVTSF
ncbi:hypothetical protein LINGRAHAP2_LOCUS23269 [Linum grandiflorum]